MIQDKATLKMYLAADRFALGKEGKSAIFSFDKVWRYQILLRKYEYYKNRSVGYEFLAMAFTKVRLKSLSYRLGFSIPINCFGPGLRINHSGLLVVNSVCKIGKWCDIHQGVNIGDNGVIRDNTWSNSVPIIGDYCFIGPGAKLFGGIVIGNEVRIGANSVVTKDLEDGVTAYGIPVVTHHTDKSLKTIASKDFEAMFLEKHPEYIGLI